MKNIHSLVVFLILTFGTVSTIAQTPSGPNSNALKALTRNDLPGAVRIIDSDIADGKNLFESFKFRSELKNLNGDFTGAFADITKALEIKSTAGGLYQQRAILRMVLGQEPNRILEDLDLAISFGVKHEKMYSTRGMIRINAGDLDGGISDYKLAIGLRPGYAQPTVGLASAYRKKGGDNTAAKILEDFVATVENLDKRVRPLGGTVTASNTVETRGLDGSTKTRETTTLLVGQAVTLKNMPSAQEMEQMGDRMEQTKNTAAAYAHLASLYEKRKELDKALITSDKGIKIDPNDFYGLGIRGIVKLELRDFNGAVTDLDRAIRITPKNASLYLNRGIAHLLLDKQSEAQRDFDKYLELNPSGKPFLDKQIEYARKMQTSDNPML